MARAGHLVKKRTSAIRFQPFDCHLPLLVNANKNVSILSGYKRSCPINVQAVEGDELVCKELSL